MRLFGLIGYPLSHSFSKKYFTEKFEKEHLDDCTYENFSISSIELLTEILSKYPELEGLNVTIPYKESVLSFLSIRSEVVKEIKSCNCIKIIESNLVGFNTDVAGFEKSLLKKLKPHHQNALILGTGGASKAVAHVLKRLGIGFRYVSRNIDGKNLRYKSLDKEVMSKHTLIINTTPVGMSPDLNKTPELPYQYLTKKHFLFDLIYNPAKTMFLKMGEEKGCLIENGYEMLIIQAEESWKVWNNH